MSTALSKIIELLHQLNKNELSQLHALISVRSAAAINSGGSGRSGQSGTAGNASGQSKTRSGGGKKNKVPLPNKVSPYKDNPIFEEFKASEKALNAYLRDKQGDEKLLSHWVNKRSEIMKLSPAERNNLMSTIPRVVAGFIEARDNWIHAKGTLSVQPASAESDFLQEVTDQATAQRSSQGNPSSGGGFVYDKSTEAVNLLKR